MIGKIIGLATVVTFLGFAAQAEETGGIIASFNESTRALMLDNGKLFVISDAVETKNIVEGIKVVLDYEVDGDRMVINEIRVQ